MLPDLITRLDLTTSDIFLVLAMPFAIWFVITYGALSPWYRHPLGVVTFLHSLSVSSLLFLIVWGIVFGQKVDEPYRLAIAALLFLALVSKVIILHVERHNGRIERRRLRAERHLVRHPDPTEGSNLMANPSPFIEPEVKPLVVGETVSSDSPKVTLGKGKAIIAAVAGLAVAVGPLLANALEDGAIDTNEGITLFIAVLVGLGVPGLGTYFTPTKVTRNK